VTVEYVSTYEIHHCRLSKMRLGTNIGDRQEPMGSWWSLNAGFNSTQKTAYKNLGFFKLASIGSYINGVYCEIRLPRFLIRFLIQTTITTTTTCTHRYGLYIESFTVQYCGLVTLPVSWLVFFYLFGDVLYDIWKNSIFWTKRTCIEILA